MTTDRTSAVADLVVAAIGAAAALYIMRTPPLRRAPRLGDPEEEAGVGWLGRASAGARGDARRLARCIG